MNTTAELFRDRADRFSAIVDGAQGQWDVPTPCDEWAVADVVRHAIETERDFLAQRHLEVGDAPSAEDPAKAWREHAAAVIDALGRPGVAETAYDSYFGHTTIGDTMADFYGWDLVIHGWDVAVATGQQWSVTDEEAARLHATAAGFGDALYMEGICGPAVDVGEGASPQERLLARLGRDPQWRAA